MTTPPRPQPAKPPKKRDELSAMRLIVACLQGQTPAARGRIIAYLDSYFMSEPTDKADGRSNDIPP